MGNLRDSINAKESVLRLADTIQEESWRTHKDVIVYEPKNIEPLYKAFQDNYDYMEKNGMVAGTTDLDRFKVVSAYTKAALTHPLFTINKEKLSEKFEAGAIPMRVCIPNEYFIEKMIRSLMHDLCRVVKKNMWDIDEYHFYLPSQLYSLKCQGDEFVMTASGFDQIFPKLLRRYSGLEDVERFPLFAFSHLLCLLEIINDCANFNQTRSYFPVKDF